MNRPGVRRGSYNPDPKRKTVILSEPSELVAPAFGATNNLVAESKDLYLRRAPHTGAPGEPTLLDAVEICPVLADVGYHAPEQVRP
jgi:hypothetical protein